MKRIMLALLMVATVFCLPSCNQPEGTTWDWEKATPLIENAATMAAQVAFAQPVMQPHKEKVCEVVLMVADALENYDDPDATFNTMRQHALDVIRNLPPETLSDEIKPLVITAVDSVMNGAWLFVRQYYSDAIERDEAQVALAVGKAVSKGIAGACGIQTFSDGFEVVIVSE